MAEWKLVPVGPTPEMMRAYEVAFTSSERFDGAKVYKAMLAAAPQAPSGQQAEPTDAEIMALAVDMDLDHLPISAKRFARAVLALAHRQSEWRLLPAKMLMPDPTWEGDVDEATYKAGWNDCIDALAGQQSGQPAPAGPMPREVIERLTLVDRFDVTGEVWLLLRSKGSVAKGNLVHGTGTIRVDGEFARSLSIYFKERDAALAASQAERPAVKEGD